MSAARKLLNLPHDADDYALIGVARAATQAQIIEAAQGRLRTIGGCSMADAAQRGQALREIREAAHRIMTLQNRVTPAAPTSPRAATSSNPRTPAQRFGSMAAIVFMRRDPRRARLILARARSASAQRGFRAPAPAQALESGAPLEPETARRTPWILAALVVLSIVGLITEIVLMRAPQPSSVVEESQPPETAPIIAPSRPSDSAPSSPPDTRTAAQARADNSLSEGSAVKTQKTNETAAAAERAAAQRIAAEAPNRVLRERWQQAARAAFDVPGADMEVVADMGVAAVVPPAERDALDGSLLAAILIERMMALDLVARQLERGADREASLVLDTISSESTVRLPPLAPSSDNTGRIDDGELRKGLMKFSGSNQGRPAMLRAYRTRPDAPGALDAQTLVQEVLKGPSALSRTIAQGILVDRGRNALSVLEAVNERFEDLAMVPALAGMIRALSGVDPDGIEGSTAARAAIISKMIALRGSRASQLDSASHDLAVTLRKIAQCMSRASDSEDPAELLALVRPQQAATSMRSRPAAGGSLHALVKHGTELLWDQAGWLENRQPADRSVIVRVLADAAVERTQASTALGQALANARGILALDAIMLGVARLEPDPALIADAGESMEWAVATPAEVAARWGKRLEALNPSQVEEYLLLAEEVADESNDPATRDLARQLYALAGALNAGHLGTSAALGLAALEDPVSGAGRARSRQWVARAQRYSDEKITLGADGVASLDWASRALRVGIVDALEQYRRGYGRRANDRLKKPQVRALFESVMHAVPGGAEEFDRLAAVHVNGSPMPLSEETTEALLRLERALLRTSDQWSDALALGAGGPVVDAPIGSPSDDFGVDLRKCIWREGRWVEVAPPAK